MGYLIMFLAIAAVLGPLMAVMPSKRQRAVASLRDQARALGISVSLREPDNVPPRLQFDGDRARVCYSRRLPARGPRPTQRDTYVRTRDGWRSRSSDPVPGPISELPDAVQVVQVGWDDVRLYWDETGGETALAPVANALGFLLGDLPAEVQGDRQPSDHPDTEQL